MEGSVFIHPLIWREMGGERGEVCLPVHRLRGVMGEKT